MSVNKKSTDYLRKCSYIVKNVQNLSNAEIEVFFNTIIVGNNLVDFFTKKRLNHELRLGEIGEKIYESKIAQEIEVTREETEEEANKIINDMYDFIHKKITALMSE